MKPFFEFKNKTKIRLNCTKTVDGFTVSTHSIFYARSNLFHNSNKMETWAYVMTSIWRAKTKRQKLNTCFCTLRPPRMFSTFHGSSFVAASQFHSSVVLMTLISFEGQRKGETKRLLLLGLFLFNNTETVVVVHADQLTHEIKTPFRTFIFVFL